jgi:HAD superfamily hydrolase (TIGR01490 family)
MRKAAFFDVDGTLTTGNVWRCIMDYFKDRGERRFTNAFYWAYNTPSYLLFKMGLISQGRFRRGWALHLPWFFRGYSEADAERVWEGVLADYLSPLWRTDSRALLEEHSKAGDLVVLVSGGPTPLVERIAGELGADFGVGTDMLMYEGRYTGGSGEVCQGAQKAALTRKRLDDEGITVDFAASTAYADSSADVELLEMAGHAVALHPDEHLRPIAEARGWEIVE